LRFNAAPNRWMIATAPLRPPALPLAAHGGEGAEHRAHEHPCDGPTQHVVPREHVPQAMRQA
jgi:hypothetical protein